MNGLSEWDVFVRNLAAVRRRHRLGQIGVALLRLVAGSLAFLGGLILFDRFAALPEHVRAGILVIWAGTLLVGLALSWSRALRFSLHDAASLADRAAGHRRKPVLTALELGIQAPTPTNDLTGYLRRRSLQAGESALTGLPRKRAWPVRCLRRAATIMMAGTGILLGILLLQGTAARPLLARVFRPHHDIPPVSPYSFHIEPDAPAVIYGETITLSVDIDGPRVRDHVWLRTRTQAGLEHRAACFQESSHRFVQKLENVQQEMEFCFGIGRSRSRWYRVRLLLQPRVLTARATLTPPAYTNQGPRKFFVGNEVFAGLPGTAAEVVLTSNRPLLDGRLEIRPRARPEDIQTEAAEIRAGNRAVFSWTMHEPAEIQLTLRDLQGTPSTAPLVIDQRLVPDLPPDIVIVHPPPYSLATPDAELVFRARLTDDFGLQRLDWVRTLGNYRERFLPVTVPHGMRHADFRRELDLEMLGCEPGQDLEFYFEALDNNPRGTGFAASPIVRVRIISTEEYANMLRAQILLSEFQARFAEAAQRMQELRQALEALRDADSPEEQAAARAAAQTALEAAETFYRQLAADFAAYDIERELSTVAAETADRIARAAVRLAASTDPAAAAADMLKEFAPSADDLEQLRERAETMAKVGTIMEQAMEFARIVHRQRELTRALSRYLDPTGTGGGDPARLPMFGERQAAILQQLRDWQRDTLAAAEKLPLELEPLAWDVMEFIETLKRGEAEGLMEQAARAAAQRQGQEAHRLAALALEWLEALLDNATEESGNCMAGLCAGFLNPKTTADAGGSGLSQALQQLLDAICRRTGFGSGSGAGFGSGRGFGIGMGIGEGQTGSGYSSLDMPVHGPRRTRFGPMVPTTAGFGSGHGEGYGTDGSGIGADARSMLVSERQDRLVTRAAAMDQVPEKYREAVKRYFSE